MTANSQNRTIPRHSEPTGEESPVAQTAAIEITQLCAGRRTTPAQVTLLRDLQSRIGSAEMLRAHQALDNIIADLGGLSKTLNRHRAENRALRQENEELRRQNYRLKNDLETAQQPEAQRTKHLKRF